MVNLNLKKTILVLFLALIFNLGLVGQVMALDLYHGPVYDSAKNTAVASGYADRSWYLTDLQSPVASIIQYALSFLAAAFMILIIYGGILWMISSGNEEKLTKARNLLINGLIGFCIVLGAYVITYFIIHYFGQATNFSTGLGK